MVRLSKKNLKRILFQRMENTYELKFYEIVRNFYLIQFIE